MFKKNDFPVEDELSLNLIRTDDIARYYLGVPSMKVFYPCELDAKGDTSVMDINSIASKFPEGYSYIMDNEDVSKIKALTKLIEKSEGFYVFSATPNKEITKLVNEYNGDNV